VRAYRRVGRLEECARATVQHASRELTYYYDDDGSLVIRVRLPADEGAVVLQALNAAMDAQQCDTQSDDVTAVTSRVEDRFAQRRADALTTLAVGFRAVVIAASSMRITSNTGQTAARRRSTISCYCAAVTTVWCTKRIRFTRPDGRAIDDHPRLPGGTIAAMCCGNQQADQAIDASSWIIPTVDTTKAATARDDNRLTSPHHSPFHVARASQRRCGKLCGV